MTENYFTLWDEKMNTVDVLSGTFWCSMPSGASRSPSTATLRAAGPITSPAPHAHEFYIRDVMLDWRRRAERAQHRKTGGAYDHAAAKHGRAGQAHGGLHAALRRIHPEALPRDAARAGQPVLARARSRQGRSAAQAGLHRGQLRARRRPGAGDRRERRRRRLLRGSYEQHLGHALEIVSRTSSLNPAQSIPNADGSYTFVLSLRDPGVHNWIDPCGLGEGILTLRMAEFPEGRPREDLSAKSRVVPLASLRATLPKETCWVDPEARARRRPRARRPTSRRPSRRPEGEGELRVRQRRVASVGLARHRLLDRLRTPDRARRAGQGAPRRGDRAQSSASRRRGRASRAGDRTGPRRDGPRPDRAAVRAAEEPSARSTCSSTTPATATWPPSKKAKTPRSARCSTPTTSASST